MPPLIAVVQRKGGVGKTTLTICLAGEFIRRGYQPVVVDSDLQGSASQWANPGLLPFQVRQLPLQLHQGRSWALDLSQLPSELSIIDTAPNEYAVAAAIAVATLALVPCTPSGLDLEATLATLGIVREVRARRRDKLAILIVPNRVDSRTLEGRQLVEELRTFGEPVAPAIGARSAFVRAFSAGETIYDFAPESAADQDIRALADHAVEALQLRRVPPEGRKTIP